MATKLNHKNVITSDGVQYQKLNSDEYAFINVEVNKQNKWSFHVEYVRFDGCDNIPLDSIRVSLEEFPTFLALMQAGGWQKCED